MKTIRGSSIYQNWIENLRDSRARYRILARIKRLESGNAGDVKPVGEGVSEMRIDYGPGYRVYYKDVGMEIIILLCGGDKSSQCADIDRAKQIAAQYIGGEDGS